MQWNVQTEPVPSSTSRTWPYAKKLLVASFVVRHWSPYLHPSGGEYGTIPVARSGMEIYYQLARSLAHRAELAGRIALDVGCAAGRMTCELARAGARLAIGIDTSSQMIDWARKIAWSPRSDRVYVPVPVTAAAASLCWLRGFDLKGKTEFLLADAQNLPLADQAVHLVACLNVLHRVERPDLVLREIERVLQPGGCLVISNDYDWDPDLTPDPDLWFDNVLDVLPHTFWEKLDELDPVPYEAPVHARKYTRALNHMLLLRKRRWPR